jgi:hypothetical protein
MLVELLGTLVYIPSDKWEQVMEQQGIIDFLTS